MMGESPLALPPCRFVDHLARFQDVFIVEGRGAQGSVQLQPSLTTPELRTPAVARVLEQLRQEGVIGGWRNELYPVTSSFYSDPLLLVGGGGGDSC